MKAITYRFEFSEALYLGNHKVLLRSSFGTKFQLLESHFKFLQSTPSLKTDEEWTGLFSGTILKGDLFNSRILVNNLKELKFLLSDIQILEELESASLNHQHPNGTRIIIGIPTKNRGEALKECLSSLLPYLRKTSVVSKVMISDDSNIEHAKFNIELLEHFRNLSPIPIEYWGKSEKLTWLKKLSIKSGCEESQLKKTFILDSSEDFLGGANKNFILLKSAGSNLIILDDDSRFNLRHYKKPENATLTNRDPRQILALPREWAATEDPIIPEDIFLDINQLLGPTLNEMKLNLKLASHFMYRKGKTDWTSQSNRLVWLGFYGDSGMSYPTYMISSQLKDSELLKCREEDFLNRILGRQVISKSDDFYLALDLFQPSACIAYNNSEMLPLFMPKHRGEDYIFGELMRFCFPNSLNTFTPWTIEHRPIPVRSNCIEDLNKGAINFRFVHLISSIIQSVAPALLNQSPQSRMEKLGSLLIDWIDKTPNELKQSIINRHRRQVSHSIAQLEQTINSSGNSPDFLKTYRQDLLSTLQNYLEGGHHFTVTEFADSPPHESTQKLMNEIRLFAEALIIWPKLWLTSRKLNGISETKHT